MGAIYFLVTRNPCIYDRVVIDIVKTIQISYFTKSNNWEEGTL